MESEKVREIKKGLEYCSNPICEGNNKCPYHNMGCMSELSQDALTLINELEKENARLLDSVETVQSNRCTTKCELTKKHLKQFAERLKEKCEWNKKQYCCEATVSANDIDETLKEFI